jgi:carboxyl-terminal processing protease
MKLNWKNLTATATALAAMALASLPTAALAQAEAAETEPPEFSEEMRDEVLERMERVLTRRAFVPGVDFNQWPEMLAAHEEKLLEAKNSDDFAGVVNDALREFGYSHIVLYSPEYAERRATGKMVGLGVRIQVEENGLRITSIFPGSAASEVDIRPGDLIFEADGEPVRTPLDLAGEEGSEVTVKVEREESVVEVDVTRRSFDTKLPETIEFRGQTAIITIPTFDIAYDHKKVEELFETASEAESLVLDLRGNGGGQVMNLLHLSGLLMEQNTPLGTFVGRPLWEDYVEEVGEEPESAVEVAEWTSSKLVPGKPPIPPFMGDVVVLIDGGTGSASEIMASALKEQRGATLIGSKSAGAVLASIMMPINHNFLLQYPVTDYVTYEGYRIEGNGVPVDIEAAIPRFGEEDEGIAKALEVLTAAEVEQQVTASP